MQKMTRLVCALALAVSGISAAHADDGGVGVRVGATGSMERVEAYWTSPVLWSYQGSDARPLFDLSLEAGVAYWHARGSRKPSSLWQVAATPMFRWWMTDSVFLEAGIGVSAFNRTRFADKNISTAFQFSDQLGIGWQISSSQQIGLRLSHYSNAGIKRPNPGLDMVQFNYRYSF